MLPVPKLILNNLHKRKIIDVYKNLLNEKSGVYAFINLINGMRYIGSSKNIYKRFREHILGRSSNKLLQKDFKKYGLNKFIFVIYAYSDNKQNLIIDLENKYISLFPFSMLYNLTPTAGSMLGYKHSEESILKMKK
jgi:group I intron endonuclease